MNSKLYIVLVVFAFLAILVPAIADPGLGILGGLKEMADDVLSLGGIHNQAVPDNTAPAGVVHHHHG